MDKLFPIKADNKLNMNFLIKNYINRKNRKLEKEKFDEYIDY